MHIFIKYGVMSTYGITEINRVVVPMIDKIEISQYC